MPTFKKNSQLILQTCKHLCKVIAFKEMKKPWFIYQKRCYKIIERGCRWYCIKECPPGFERIKVNDSRKITSYILYKYRILVLVWVFPEWLQNLHFFSKLYQLLMPLITQTNGFLQRVNNIFGEDQRFRVNIVMPSIMEDERLLAEPSLELELLCLEECVECDLPYQRHMITNSPHTL